MRRISIILAISILGICFQPSLFAQKKPINYEDFFLQKQSVVGDYDNYKGAIIAFYEPAKSDKAQFNLDGIELGAPYVINKISFYYALGLPYVELRISKKGEKEGKGIRIKCFNGESTDKKPGLVDLPAYFFEPVEKLKDEFLGKSMLVNGKMFTITGIGFDNHLVSFVFSSDEGDVFEEPVNEALAYMYEDSLISVEKPENEAIQYGKISILTENRLTKYFYADNVLLIAISHNDSLFSFSLHNLSDNTLKIIWDEAAFVDANGTTSKVIHSGVKYNEKEKAQIPSIVVKGAKLDDVVAPVDRIRPGFQSWESLPFYDQGQVGNVALLIPIQIKGVTNEYIFVFEKKLVLRHPELHLTSPVSN